MERRDAVSTLDRLHAFENRFYAGEDVAGQLALLLTPEVLWMVPGPDDVAGCYEGVDEVLGYFERRRSLADNTVRTIRRDVLAGTGDVVVALTDVVRLADDLIAHWHTVGLYRVVGTRVDACWQLQLDSDRFDRLWTRDR